MGDSYHLNACGCFSIDDQKWKPAQTIKACPMKVKRPLPRGRGNLADGAIQFVHEALGERCDDAGVASPGRACFSNGLWVKVKIQRRHQGLP